MCLQVKALECTDKDSNLVNYIYKILCGQPYLKQPNNQKKAIEFNFHDDLNHNSIQLMKMDIRIFLKFYAMVFLRSVTQHYIMLALEAISVKTK